MKEKKQFGLAALYKRSATVIAASLSLLANKEARANEGSAIPASSGAVHNAVSRSRMLKPKLTLRLNPYRPENSLLAYHSSHSSHSSHASHSSHSSGGYASGRSSDGGGGLGLLAVGGAVAYGIYRLSRNNNSGKK